MKKISRVISEFDASEYLQTPDDIIAYLNAVIEDGDQELFIAALGDVAKAIGMAQIAKETGLGRESLYKTFSGKTKPRFETITSVLNAVGATITLTKKMGH
ncbi:putative addiction module antidote protein [Advenella sp. WQ 585]|uniref:Addiction module antidote protein n=1 Tax=Advenella mandrilli TaxID=2800330 RepID=A0ABS1EI07_9BURK|nr:addiction module antidote protein [Advenella mandrilli]MBK1782670.1 putative addiction module antidote protein [Advenella mandrilli]